MRRLLLAVAFLLGIGVASASAQSTMRPCYDVPGAPCQTVSLLFPFPVALSPTGAVPYQFTVPGPMQSQLSVTTGATTTLTVPAGSLYWKFCIRAGAASAVNYSIDGLTTPATGATGNGDQLAVGACTYYTGISLANNFKAVAATATTAIDVVYLK